MATSRARSRARPRRSRRRRARARWLRSRASRGGPSSTSGPVPRGRAHGRASQHVRTTDQVRHHRSCSLQTSHAACHVLERAKTPCVRPLQLTKRNEKTE
eukprot:6174922-Pleurochrysis_carterae.AAC.3